mmetsp:Transcript_22327/g.60333  ORF Transcript_22327/g.60333 Transcript_22327/m.60333 type:complete len:345 (+) Transcript_22327:75-1109(+)
MDLQTHLEHDDHGAFTEKWLRRLVDGVDEPSSTVYEDAFKALGLGLHGHGDLHHQHRLSSAGPSAPEQHGEKCPMSREPLVFQRPRDCQAQASKKRRCQWTSELHSVFEDAVRKAGRRPTPTAVHAAMDTTRLQLDFELTVGMVKSHLQKYKLECQCPATGMLITGPNRGESFSGPADNSRGVLGRSPVDQMRTLAEPHSPSHGKTDLRPEGILVNLLDAPCAMGVLIRTFPGYELSYHYEHEGNALMLKALPPKKGKPGIDLSVLEGLPKLELLREARVHEQAGDELSLAFERKCVLPHVPHSLNVEHWEAQLVSTGDGDKTVCLQIEKAKPADTGAARIIIE